MDEAGHDEVDAIFAAVADAGVEWNDIQFATGGSWTVANPDAIVGMVGLTGIPFTNVFNACATAASAAKACADGIRLGDYDIGIAIGLDKHPRGAFTEDPALVGMRQSLGRLENQRFGFETRNRLMLDVDLALGGGATPERLRALYQALTRRLARIPGVASASLALYSPLEGINWSDPICIEGVPGRIPARDDERAPSVDAYETLVTIDVQTDRVLFLERLWIEIRALPLDQRRALLLNLEGADGGDIQLFEWLGVASIRGIAAVLEMDAEAFAALWNELPLDDLRIAEMFGINRQRVINLRSSARKRLLKRTKQPHEAI